MASSNNKASGGSKQNNIGFHASFFKKLHYHFNFTPKILRSSVAAPLDVTSIDDNTDLWTRAYGLAQKRDEKLMNSYMKHLIALQGDGGSTAEGDLSDPTYAKFVVNRLLKTRRKSTIQVSLPRANPEIQNEIEKLAKYSTGFDEVIKAASKGRPHVALAWSGVSIFLSLLADASMCNKAMLEGFNALIEMQAFWRNYETAHLKPSQSRPDYHLRSSVAELYSLIIEYQARAICHISEPPILRTFKRVTGSADWTEMMQPIQDLEQNCLRHIKEGQKAGIYMNSRSTLEAIQKQVILQEEILQGLKNDKRDDMERELLGDLLRVSKGYKRYKDINPNRVPGTCEWFLMDERFCKWRDSQAGALLWVSAGPGCGKSVLSRTLIDERHLFPNSLITIESSVIKSSKKPLVICYFFFKEGDEGRMDGAHALCAILYQLFTQAPTSDLISHALPSHRNHQEALTQNMEELWQILIDCAKSSSTDIVCLLDALDECEGNSARQLLSMIENSYSHQDELLRSSKLKFLITSRPYDDLKWSFDKLQPVATYMHFDGDEKFGQISEEINLVIDVKVKHIAGPFSDEDRDKISKRLKSMKNRTYLWLHLTLDIIETKRSAYSRSADIEKLLCELPSKVADAYENILSRSQDEKKVEALLQIVLAATRPLTLDEANIALALAVEPERFSSYAALEGKLWPQKTFKTTVQNLCGLFISIHSSQLSFIHLTAREFLVSNEKTGSWKGRLSLSKSHSVLSRACIEYLHMLEPSCQNLSERYPFLPYAAKSWWMHFPLQDADSTEILRKPARELLRGSAPRMQCWAGEVYATNYYREQTDLQNASSLGLAAVVYDIVVHERADPNEGKLVSTPFRLALGGGYLEVMRVLLDPMFGVEIDDEDMRAAARKGPQPESLIDLLLDKGGSRANISQRLLMDVTGDKNHGAAIMEVILTRRGDEIYIPEWLVGWAASRGSIETMALFLNHQRFNITEYITKCATHNRRDMLTMLFNQRGHQVKITERVLVEAMAKSPPETLDLVLDHSIGIKITHEMVLEAIRSVELNMTVLLEKRGREITITDEIIIGAAESINGFETISLLLQERGHEITITEEILKAAAKNKNGSEIISLLLDKRGDEVTITEDIIKAAAESSDGFEIISLLLDEREDEITITEDIIKAAAENKSGFEIISLLLHERGHEIIITEAILKAAAENTDGYEIISLLLHERGDEIKITDSIVKTAAENKYGLMIVSLLLDKRGHEIIITESIMKAAAGNPFRGREIVSLLLRMRGDEIIITDAIVEAAAANSYKSQELVSLLLDRRGDRVTITDVVGEEEE